MELKVCPFCGGKGYLETNQRNFIYGKPCRVAYVRCTQCCARSGKVPLAKYGKTSHSIEAVKDAVNSWNKRSEKNE